MWRERPTSGEDAIAKVQAELDRPYGFLGGWTTVDTDMDIAEATSTVGQTPQQINLADGSFLLSIKAATAYLGISSGAMYELLNSGEIAHVAIGSRKYVSRDQLTAFVDANRHTGYHRR